MHRFLRRTHAVGGDAAIIAGAQHRPLGERHEDRIIDPQLHRQFDLALRRVEARGFDVLLEPAHDRRILVAVETRAFEIGRQRDQKFIRLAVGRTDRLRVGAVERDLLGIDRIPNARIGVGRFERLVIQSGDALDVGQRRHVHDRHAGHARFADRIEQFAHAGRTILRLLHAEADQVVILRIDAGRGAGGHLARQLAQFQQHRFAAPAHRQLHLEALGIDQIGFRRQADEMDRMAAEQQFGSEQRSVRRAEQENLVARRLRRRRFLGCGFLGSGLLRLGFDDLALAGGLLDRAFRFRLRLAHGGAFGFLHFGFPFFAFFAITISPGSLGHFSHKLRSQHSDLL